MTSDMGMVERVARAIHEAWAKEEGSEVTWPELLDRAGRDGYPNAKKWLGMTYAKARAAIEAMREPTPEMIATVAPLAYQVPSLDCYEIAAKAVPLLPPNNNADIADVLATMVQDHRAMIDAALKDALE